MQTFLPYPDYAMSAEVLHWRHLGKQRAEVIQILDALHEIPTAAGKPFPMSIRNHPVTRMWAGHEMQLAEYGLVVTEEWVRRGYSDNVCHDKLMQHLSWAEGGNMLKPSWFGDVDLHRSHQSNLLRKKPDHYGQYFMHVPNDLAYVYPEVGSGA